MKWYTALNPKPNRPAALGLETFESWPIFAMFLKSLGEKVASFHANSAGPCQCFIFGESNERAPNSFSPLVSRHKRTSVAPASSAFCTSSEITPGPSAYASRMCLKRVVKASL